MNRIENVLANESKEIHHVSRRDVSLVNELLGRRAWMSVGDGDRSK